MTQTRLTCTLTKADESPCQSYARVTIIDAEGVSRPRLSSSRHSSARRHHPRPG
jgi:hypothetical protein